MKKIAIITIIFIIFLVSLQGCKKKGSIDNELSKNLNTKIISGDIIKSEETHDGFHGDGKRIMVIKYNDDSVNSMLSNIQDNGQWSEFPLNESLNLLMYGGSKDNVSYAYKFAENVGIPKIEHGYYCFVNRQTTILDTDILNSRSLNFTIAMFDSDNNILYYFEIDT